MDSEETDSASDSPPPLSGDTPRLSQFIENMGLYFEEYGVPRIGGRILGLLLIASRPISPEEISETLTVSRSSVSTNLRTLLLIGLIDRVSFSGDRNDYYVFSDEGWQVVLEIRLDRIEALRQMVADSTAAIQDQHPARARLAELGAWAGMVETAYHGILQEWQSRKDEAV